jgi:hypothetical protein
MALFFGVLMSLVQAAADSLRASKQPRHSIASNRRSKLLRKVRKPFVFKDLEISRYVFNQLAQMLQTGVANASIWPAFQPLSNHRRTHHEGI